MAKLHMAITCINFNPTWKYRDNLRVLISYYVTHFIFDLTKKKINTTFLSQ